MADIDPQAQAANTSTEAAAATPAAEPQESNAGALRDQLQAQLNDPNWKPEVKAEEKPAETKEAAPQRAQETQATEAGAQPQNGEQPTATPSETAKGNEPEEGDPASKRFRFSDPADRRFAVLRKEGVGPEEAARIAYGIGAQQETAATAATGENDNDGLAALETELQGINEQLTAAGADEGLMNTEIMELLTKRTDLTARVLVEQRFQADHTQRAAQSHAQSQKVVAKTAITQFPSLSDKASPLRAETERLRKEFAGSEFIRREDAPLRVAEIAAQNVAQAQAKANGTTFDVEYAKLTPAPAQAAQSQQSQETQTANTAQVTTAKKVTPASGSQGTRQPDQPKSEQEQLAATSSDPRTEYERLASMFRT